MFANILHSEVPNDQARKSFSTISTLGNGRQRSRRILTSSGSFSIATTRAAIRPSAAVMIPSPAPISYTVSDGPIVLMATRRWTRVELLKQFCAKRTFLRGCVFMFHLRKGDETKTRFYVVVSLQQKAADRSVLNADPRHLCSRIRS